MAKLNDTKIYGDLEVTGTLSGFSNLQTTLTDSDLHIPTSGAIVDYVGSAGYGTVTSVTAGNGMNFTTITSSGAVTLGTPGTLTASTTNAVTTTSHTHEITGMSVKTETMGTVIHGAVAGTARPSGYAYVQWIGSVEPTNATNNDIWINTE